MILIASHHEPPLSKIYVKKPECPARKSGDEWPRVFKEYMALKLNGFFFGRSPEREHGVLHP
jgi:hypothetical protein